VSSFYPGRDDSSSFSHNTSHFNLEANHSDGVNDSDAADAESEGDWLEEPEVMPTQKAPLKAPSKMSLVVANEVCVQFSSCLQTHNYLQREQHGTLLSTLPELPQEAQAREV
jgi:hypothetical protein